MPTKQPQMTPAWAIEVGEDYVRASRLENVREPEATVPACDGDGGGFMHML